MWFWVSFVGGIFKIQFFRTPYTSVNKNRQSLVHTYPLKRSQPQVPAFTMPTNTPNTPAVDAAAMPYPAAPLPNARTCLETPLVSSPAAGCA